MRQHHVAGDKVFVVDAFENALVGREAGRGNARALLRLRVGIPFDHVERVREALGALATTQNARPADDGVELRAQLVTDGG
jgi:hypothetical protein